MGHLELRFYEFLTLFCVGAQFDHVQKGYNPRVPGERLPASYINHYIANGGAVVPAYGGKASDTDKAAAAALQKAYGPERKVRDTQSCPAMQSVTHDLCVRWRHPCIC